MCDIFKQGGVTFSKQTYQVISCHHQYPIVNNSKQHDDTNLGTPGNSLIDRPLFLTHKQEEFIFEKWKKGEIASTKSNRVGCFPGSTSSFVIQLNMLGLWFLVQTSY
jgi:hypothetical protein